MRRPLVWIGAAYIMGEIWAAAGYPLYAGMMLAAAGVLLAGMILTDRYRQQILRNRLFYILPVFFVSGFVMFGRASAAPCDGLLADGTAEVVFLGEVTAREEKENTIALTLTAAQIVSAEEDGGTRETGDEAPVYRTGVLMYVDKEALCQPAVGDVIRGTGELEKPETASNPGQFDTAAYDAALGIHYLLWADEMRVQSRSHSYRQMLQRFRERVTAVYAACLPETEAGIMNAVLMGDKAMLSEDTRQLYRRVGIAHVLAISGLHISMIGMGIYRGLRRMGAGLRLSACTAAFAVLSYGVMTGFGTSTKRAVIMFLVNMGAIYLGRCYDMLSALSLAALLILLGQPLMLFQAGVQFSFAAVLSIGVLWPAMRRVTQKVLEADGPKKRWLRLLDMAGPSAAVTLGTLPLTAYYYGEVPLISFFLNLVILPLMGLLVPIGVAAGLSGLLSVKAALLLCGPVHGMLMLNQYLCQWASAIPLAVWRTGVPPLSWVCVYYALLIGFVLLSARTTGLGRAHKPADGRWLLILLLCGFILIPIRRMTPMVAFIDVGQGDSIFIRTPSGSTWLVDGGSTDVKEVGAYRIKPFLAYYGEAGVDYACVTHGDEDHLSGIRELLAEHRIGHLVLTAASAGSGSGFLDETCAELAAMAEAAGTPVLYVAAGDNWQSGGWQFECLYPGEATDSGGDKNDQSMVLRLRAGGVDFLLTGDISAYAEAQLDAEKLTGIEVLKVAHHGSGGSSSEAFLEQAGGRLAVISCGANNRYGHPAAEAVERLRAAGMDIRMTMEEGAILMLYKREGFQVRGWRTQ